MMVTLASYESSQHCASAVTCLNMSTMGIGISPRMPRSLTCGFLQTSSFRTGFANDRYTSAVSSASVGLATV